MLKVYYNGSDKRRLENQSTVVFNEVSSNVYHVDKDRIGMYPDYVNADKVASALSNRDKISVIGKSGMYANFELEKND